jgi:hypothetical protein
MGEARTRLVAIERWHVMSSAKLQQTKYVVQLDYSERSRSTPASPRAYPAGLRRELEPAGG